MISPFGRIRAITLPGESALERQCELLKAQLLIAENRITDLRQQNEVLRKRFRCGMTMGARGVLPA